MPQRSIGFGDTVFVPDGYGTWVNGIVNVVDGRTALVAVAPGAHQSGAEVVRVRRREYMTDWAWPEDMPGLVAN